MTERWKALATAVRTRRDRMQLRQADLEPRGGPSGGTVRNIEQAARSKYAARTFVQLERALDWPDGTVQRILDGTVTDEELNDVVVRDRVSGALAAPASAASANLGGLTPRVGGGFTPPRRSGPSVGELLAGVGAAHSSADALALNSAFEILKPTFEQRDSVMRSFLAGMAPQLGGVAAALQSAAGATAATAALAAFADSMRVYESPFRLALGDLARFSTPAIDVTEALGLSNSLRALAIPPPDPEIAALWKEFDQKADAIAAEPWFDEDGDMTIEEAVRRYNEEHPEDDVAAPVHHRREVTDPAGVTDAAVASVTGSEVTATAHAEDRDEPPLAEVIPGRWSTVFVAQQEVGDVRDLALASELFARVSRRPQSEERTAQLRALNVLIEEFISDQESADDLRSRRRG